MADPQEGIEGVRLHRVTEGTVSVSDAGVTNIDTGNSEKITLMNKGANKAYFRCDGTTPTAGAAGNGDVLTVETLRTISVGKIEDVKLICDTGESATVFYRLFS